MASAYSHIGALRNCNVKKTRRELSRWELRNRATRADTLSKRAVHVQPPQLSTACLRDTNTDTDLQICICICICLTRPQHELREQRQHCTSSSTQIEPSMWAMTSTAVNACGVVLRRIGHRGRRPTASHRHRLRRACSALAGPTCSGSAPACPVRIWNRADREPTMALAFAVDTSPMWSGRTDPENWPS